MSKASILMACNWAMALAGIVVVALSVRPMFSPPWVPAPAAPELSSPVVPNLPKPAIQQSRAQSIPANLGAAPAVVKQTVEATEVSPMTQPNQPTSTPSLQTQQAPQASQPPSSRKEMHRAVPKPTPPNVIPVYKYRPELGDF
jgi:hypothetical protein